MAKFSLHTRRPLPTRAPGPAPHVGPYQARDLQQIVEAKVRCPVPDGDPRIERCAAGPADRKGLQMTLGVARVDACLTPRASLVEELELAAGEGMEGMCDPEYRPFAGRYPCS